MLSKLRKFNADPSKLIYTIPFALSSGFIIWRALLNNYVVEVAKFTGKDIGLLQSAREIPGLLAVTALIFIAFISEQTFIGLSLLGMGLFIMLFGQFSTTLSLTLTCLLFSFGFHYTQTLRKSLATQLIAKEKLSHVLGKYSSITAFVSILAFIFVLVGWRFLHLSYPVIFAIGGGITVIVALYILFAFPKYTIQVEQHKKPRFYKQYWIYYTLNVFSGGRRQIFVVFAPFLLVSTFHLSIDKLALLFLASQLFTMYVAPKVGKLIANIGERNVLLLEYAILVFIFLGYVLVQTTWQAVILYILDNIMFSLSFSLDSYFKRIAEKEHIATTAALSFTMNHILAVILPISLGYIWLFSHQWVFSFGVLLAFGSLLGSACIPRNPTQGFETIFRKAA